MCNCKYKYKRKNKDKIKRSKHTHTQERWRHDAKSWMKYQTLIFNLRLLRFYYLLNNTKTKPFLFIFYYYYIVLYIYIWVKNWFGSTTSCKVLNCIVIFCCILMYFLFDLVVWLYAWVYKMAKEVIHWFLI